jgi:hypothetical protein
LAALAAPALIWAQVSIYSFEQSVQPYTEITAADGGYSMGTPVWWPPYHNMRAFVDPNYPDGVITNGGYLSPAVGPGYPIGFDFTFNGEVFDRVGISHGGWISFGKSSDGAQAVWCYTADHPHGRPFVQYFGGPSVPYKRNRVAGFATAQLRMQDMTSQDPPGPLSSLRLATIGTAPNRVCVIQWKDFRASYSPSPTLINFQIRLNEADNSVEVRYGNMVFAFEPGGDTQVGLGGQVPEDFNSRTILYQEPAFLYDWNSTTAGTANTDGCLATTEEFGHPNGSGVPPEEGLNFKWTPPVCAPPAWPLTLSDISFDYATAQWMPTSAGEYEYFVSTADSLTGEEIASGTTTDPEASIFGLTASTTYYIWVRSICDGEPGTWSTATAFETLGGGYVTCDGTVLTENYCSKQFDTKEWLYVSSDGSPLKIEFLDGLVGNVGTESFQVWDGTSDAGVAAPPMTGDLTGYEFTATSGAIFIRLVTDAGACEAQPWYLPLQWRVGCKNCTDPLANFSVVEDCANQQYSVEVNIFNLGSSTSVSLENNLGVPPVTVSSTGTHMAGPFPAGQSVVVTVQNPDNPMCYSASTPLINAPCAIQDCGPTNYTYCYGDNESSQWAYQGEDDQEIGIRFTGGSVGMGDVLRSYNGLDIDNLTPTNHSGGLTNLLITSAAPSTDHAVVLALQSDNAVSCADADTLFGSSAEWAYVVACYDGCTQPQASFTGNCLSQTQFEVNVNITNIGSAGTATITNDGGAPTVTANAPGGYTVGPFTVGTPVTLEVEGASVLCSWTSPAIDPDCSNVGIAESAAMQLGIIPNPSNGAFRVVFPSGMTGLTEMKVADLAGRTIYREIVKAEGSTLLDLGELPNGLYILSAQDQTRHITSTISIQH